MSWLLSAARLARADIKRRNFFSEDMEEVSGPDTGKASRSIHPVPAPPSRSGSRFFGRAPAPAPI
ncbi:hypothetical protein GCM10027161_18120 [Microbispora hainanensis]